MVGLRLGCPSNSGPHAGVRVSVAMEYHRSVWHRMSGRCLTRVMSGPTPWQIRSPAFGQNRIPAAAPIRPAQGLSLGMPIRFLFGFPTRGTAAREGGQVALEVVKPTRPSHRKNGPTIARRIRWGREKSGHYKSARGPAGTRKPQLRCVRITNSLVPIKRRAELSPGPPALEGVDQSGWGQDPSSGLGGPPVCLAYALLSAPRRQLLFRAASGQPLSHRLGTFGRSVR